MSNDILTNETMQTDFLKWITTNLQENIFTKLLVPNIGYTDVIFTITARYINGVSFLQSDLRNVQKKLTWDNDNLINVPQSNKLCDSTKLCFKPGGSGLDDFNYDYNGNKNLNVRFGKIGPKPDIALFIHASDSSYIISEYNKISTTATPPVSYSYTINVNFDSLHPSIFSAFLISDSGSPYLKSACLNTQTFGPFAQFNNCNVSTGKYPFNSMLNVNYAAIPNFHCTENVNKYCANNGIMDSSFCGCFIDEENIPEITKTLLQVNKNIYPDGLCKPGQIKNTCIPRFCVLPSCMSGKAYKSAEALRYKCPKLCSSLLNIKKGNNSEVNYTNSNINVTCPTNSIFVGDKNLGAGLNDIKITNLNSTPHKSKIKLILSIVLPIIFLIIIIVLIIYFYKK